MPLWPPLPPRDRTGSVLGGARSVVDGKERPHAVFDEIPAARQADVAAHVASSVAAWLGPDAPADARRLTALIGDPRFYDVVAGIDDGSASDWVDMAKVQRRFAAAEPSFDRKTRAYSESMRLTLHAALIEHLAEGPAHKSLFETFLELHPTAFDENGAWVDNMQIGWQGALAVVGATRPEMVFHVDDLVEGGFERDAEAVRAAAWVRAARQAVVDDL